KAVPRLGGTPRLLIAGRGLRSPDGKAVALASSGGSEIGVGRLDRGDTLRLTRPTHERWLSGLAWAAGSDRVALRLTTPEASHARLVILSLDGTTREVLQDSAGVYAPAWGPAGRSLYYLRPGRGGVDLMRAELHPDGSPSGAPIAIAVSIRAPGDSPR